MAYIELKNISKKISNSEFNNNSLKKTTLNINKGTLTILTGDENSGKNEFLNILALIDKADDGSFLLNGINLSELRSYKLTKYRRNKISFSFDSHDLIDYLSVINNINLSKEISKSSLDITGILKKFNLYKIKDKKAYELSNKERKKVSIARAVIKNPELLLLEEPTKYLSITEIQQVLNILKVYSKKDNMTIILSSNDDRLIPICDKVIYFKKGKIEKITDNKKPKLVGELIWD